jgi:putative transposase
MPRRKAYEMAMRTYKYRLYPSASQEANLFRVLNAARGLYNMALELRKVSWQIDKRSVPLKDLYELAKRYREVFPYAQQMFSQTAQSVIEQVDTAFQAFFRRVKAGNKPGYPRFKSSKRFNSVEFKQFGSGIRIDGKRLKVFGVGRVAVRWHREMQGIPKTARIKHTAGQWFVCIVCDVPDTLPLPKTGRAIGFDLGVSALITTSDGEKVDHPRFYREGQQRLRVLQRRLARAKPGSHNRRKVLRQVQRQHQHVYNQRRDFAHKLSYALVQNYDLIAVENLRMTNLVRNKHLSKSILDAGWGVFRELLTSKTASAGREVALVDPAYTSQTCSNCGAIFEHFDLSTRWVECVCGLSLDRDHNAAVNILSRAGWDAPVQPNAAPLPTSDDVRKRKRVVEAARLQL